MPNVMFARIDGYTREMIHDIRDHPCPSFVPKPVLSSEPTDTSFIREARNRSDAVEAWRKGIR